MDKVYNHKEFEENIYKLWEERGYFKPEINPDGEPYTIILPPPNANGDLHFGHAMFVIEDILIRYHRMKGMKALWLPGTDHAGTETQFVFEKKLQEQGKSRMDYGREELYQMIWDYVQENRGGIDKQLRRLGFSLDWSRAKFTLDPDIVEIVKQTFRQMYKDNLVYRDYRLVNYCTRDGTSFSDLEVVHDERVNPLYYIKYGPLTLATTRPETKFGDTAVAVHPDDDRYKQYVGKEIEIETVLGKAKIKVIADDAVDPKFGTGVVKITPAHDFNDFETGKRHNLEMRQVIGFDGKMNHHAGEFEGLYVKQARKAIVEAMQEKGLLVKVDEKYVSRIGVCYKCKTVLEPLPLEQWYVKVKPLIENANKAVDKKFVKIYPNNYNNILKQWFAGLRDWNISRQNVWGIQIPVWYEVADESAFTVSFINAKKEQQQGNLKELLKSHSWEEIEKGLQKVVAPITAKVVFEDEKEANKHYLPETDTFDTWFSSGQWPYVTLKTSHPGDFETFYPTSVMETGYDILRAWVSRMLLLGLYVANGKHETDEAKLKRTVPFKDVVLHGLVNDPLGKKMSKSKGNVVNPLQVADEYGADAVRMALVYGTALGNDQAMSYAKLDAMRKFTNKLWNMARFIEMKREDGNFTYDGTILTLKELEAQTLHDNDTAWVHRVSELVNEINKYLDAYQFNLAAERLYEFIWHEFADKYIEDVKNRMDASSFTVVSSLFVAQLKLLHPFMPFLTEAIYHKFIGETKSIMIENWPTK
jgi:valyl-tRNA synthetase